MVKDQPLQFSTESLLLETLVPSLAVQSLELMGAELRGQCILGPMLGANYAKP